MQIKLKKYFMIIRSATVGLHQWEEREEHLDHIKRIASVRGRGEPIVVSERVWTFCLIVSAYKVAHRFLAAYPPFVCHARPILHMSREPYHYNEERTRVYAISWRNRRMLTNPGGEGARWGVPQLWSGKGRICNTLDRAFKPGTTNLSKHFEGKPPP